MRRLLNKLERQRTEAVEYIENLEDSRLRQIARYKYVDGMNWEAVAKKMGTTADACRMEFKRLSKTGSK